MPLTRSAVSFPHPGGSEHRFMDIEMSLLVDMCDSQPLHLPTGRARTARIIGPWDGEPGMPGSRIYSNQKLNRGCCCWCFSAAAEAALVWEYWLGCWGRPQSQGQNLLSCGFPCQLWTHPACGSLNWALVYYCNEDPFSNVFFLALMWLNCYFSHLTFFASEMFWINMQLKWLVTGCVHF